MSYEDESVRGMLEEIKQIVVDVLSGDCSVYVSGNKISEESAKATFGRLTSEHILYVLHIVLNNPSQISKIRLLLPINQPIILTLIVNELSRHKRWCSDFPD